MDEDDKGLDVPDVKLALEQVFQGCTAETPSTMDGSRHVTVAFHEYEIRVILTGPCAPDRLIHFRFTQRIRPKAGRSPIRVTHQEFQTKNPKELLSAIREAKEYLLGQVMTLQRALKPPPGPKPVLSVDDLFS